MFQLLTLLLSACLLLLGGCSGKKQETLSSAQIVKNQYNKLLQRLWADLNSTQEKLLQILVEKEAEGGSDIHDLRDQQEVIDELIAKKLATFNTQKGKYIPTQLGADVYKEGERVAAEEAKKPENSRDWKLLKKASD